MDLASAYVLCPLAIICPRFQISPIEDVQSNNEDKRSQTGDRDRRKGGELSPFIRQSTMRIQDDFYTKRQSQRWTGKADGVTT
jgi:hypothetical protein